MSHKFKVGQIVTMRADAKRNVPGGMYEISKQLPGEGYEPEYRIKSINELHERVARENDLTTPQSSSWPSGPGGRFPPF